MHTLLLLHLRAYTNLKNYATVEIHLSGWIYSLRSQNILWTIGILCTSSRSESSMALLYHLASKQLLDEVFVISGIIKVEVSLISRAVGS